MLNSLGMDFPLTDLIGRCGSRGQRRTRCRCCPARWSPPACCKSLPWSLHHHEGLSALPLQHVDEFHVDGLPGPCVAHDPVLVRVGRVAVTRRHVLQALGKRCEYWGAESSGRWRAAWLMTITEGLCGYIFTEEAHTVVDDDVCQVYFGVVKAMFLLHPVLTNASYKSRTF